MYLGGVDRPRIGKRTHKAKQTNKKAKIQREKQMKIVKDKQTEVQQNCLPYPVKQAKITN